MAARALTAGLAPISSLQSLVDHANLVDHRFPIVVGTNLRVAAVANPCAQRVVCEQALDRISQRARITTRNQEPVLAIADHALDRADPTADHRLARRPSLDKDDAE